MTEVYSVGSSNMPRYTHTKRAVKSYHKNLQFLTQESEMLSVVKQELFHLIVLTSSSALR